MQAVVWSPQLSTLVKNLKSNATEILSTQNAASLSKSEAKALKAVFNEETDRKVEVREAWL
jgi:hypothetical protein